MSELFGGNKRRSGSENKTRRDEVSPIAVCSATLILLVGDRVTVLLGWLVIKHRATGTKLWDKLIIERTGAQCKKKKKEETKVCQDRQVFVK
jgi:hypothetical protein